MGSHKNNLKDIDVSNNQLIFGYDLRNNGMVLMLLEDHQAKKGDIIAAFRILELNGMAEEKFPQLKQFINIPTSAGELKTEFPEIESLFHANSFLTFSDYQIYQTEKFKKNGLDLFSKGELFKLKRAVDSRIRKSSVVKEAKQNYRLVNEKMPCQVCGFSFLENYGERGRYYIESHHKTRVSEGKSDEQMEIEDFEFVCSNCHRMLDFKTPFLNSNELKEVLKK